MGTTLHKSPRADAAGFWCDCTDGLHHSERHELASMVRIAGTPEAGVYNVRCTCGETFVGLGSPEHAMEPLDVHRRPPLVGLARAR